jgi:hypothetical protein
LATSRRERGLGGGVQAIDPASQTTMAQSDRRSPNHLERGTTSLPPERLPRTEQGWCRPQVSENRARPLQSLTRGVSAYAKRKEIGSHLCIECINDSRSP